MAIKSLPPEFAADADRLARFEREARLLASLNHPHIGGIYGLEEIDGATALVLELVEGETLADRLASGSLPASEALRLGLQIAEALEAAHERGVTHRDLKPADICVTPDGTVKVPFGDGGNPSPSRRRNLVAVPEGDQTPPTEVGGLRTKRARRVDFQSTCPRNPPA